MARAASCTARAGSGRGGRRQRPARERRGAAERSRGRRGGRRGGGLAAGPALDLVLEERVELLDLLEHVGRAPADETHEDRSSVLFLAAAERPRRHRRRVVVEGAQRRSGLGLPSPRGAARAVGASPVFFFHPAARARPRGNRRRPGPPRHWGRGPRLPAVEAEAKTEAVAVATAVAETAVASINEETATAAMVGVVCGWRSRRWLRGLCLPATP